ncbi:DUF58 domain-containing protein [Evansella sp. AB-P1]|uniref:DUF58 domain-containing protein n=1 Tax=Evansella sp. AB-P1 TaxID=3037653 RepID=UPI00241D6224|nr:DUF58 domain-containing protein [Evansella sp. AB-P1]MDG5786042.1 DUF58 domain-containing protein [Evansella sp. AB-P1]
MKQWKKEEHFSKLYYFLSYTLPLIIILAITLNELFLYSIAFLFILFITFNKLYLNYITKNIVIPNEAVVKKMFIGDQVNLAIPFENRGKLPIFNAKWLLFLYDSDECVKLLEDDEKNKYLSNQERYLFIPPATRRYFTVPLQAEKRGVAQVRSMEVVLYDFFKLNFVRLSYEGQYRGEAIVYPTPQTIIGLENMIQQQKGNKPQRYSYYEDVMMTTGNRDYTTGDPFNQINWKASARSQSLQTKMYEKMTLSQYTLVLNIKNENPYRQTLENLEEVLSSAAYACQFATKKQISFDMYINVKIPGSSTGLYLPLGSGEAHLMRALEMLSRIRKSNVIVPIENTLYTIFNGKNTSPYIIHFGTYTPEIDESYRMSNRNRSHIYRIDSSNGQTQLFPVGRHSSETLAN